jgi:hypothetical protein
MMSRGVATCSSTRSSARVRLSSRRSAPVGSAGASISPARRSCAPHRGKPGSPGHANVVALWRRRVQDYFTRRAKPSCVERARRKSGHRDRTKRQRRAPGASRGTALSTLSEDIRGEAHVGSCWPTRSRSLSSAAFDAGSGARLHLRSAGGDEPSSAYPKPEGGTGGDATEGSIG